MALIGCGGAADNGTSVLLTISATSSIADSDVGKIVELDVSVSGAETFTHTIALGRAFSSGRQERTLYKSKANGGQLTFAIRAVDANHQLVGYGTAVATLAAGKTVPLTVNLSAQAPPTVDATKSTLVVDKSSGLFANGSDLVTITATIVDSSGAPQAGLTVQLGATGSGNTLTQPKQMTNANGVATGTLTSVVAETKTISAVVSPGAAQVPLTQQPTVTFAATPAVQLAFTTAPVGAIAGQALPMVAVTVEDAQGTAVPGNFPITLTLSASAQHASLMGDVIEHTVTASGTAGFTALSVNLVGSGYVLTASSPGLSSAVSTTFDITPSSWFEINNGMWSATLANIWPDPKISGVAYAASGNGAVWRTTDSGLNWYSADQGLVNPGSIAFDPMDPLTQWADDGPSIYRQPAGDGLYLTSNGGAQWSKVSPAGNVANFNGPIVVDPANPQIIYVSCTVNGASSAGLCKSTDHGATFADASTGMDLVTYYYGSTAFVADATAGALYVAMTAKNRTTCAVYKSKDQAASWSPIYSGTTGCNALAVDPKTGDLWMSNSDGVSELPGGATTWVPHNSGRATAAAQNLTLAPGGDMVIYINSATTSYKSTDGGMTWGAMAPLVSGGTVLGVDAGGSTVYVSDAKSLGLQRSTDAGANFADASIGLRNATIDAFAMSAFAPSQLVATGRGFTWWSSNGGVSWTRNAGTLSGISRIAFSGESGTEVMAATATGVFSGAPTGWSATTHLPGVVSDIVAVTGAPDYYANMLSGGVYHSVDAGLDWNNINGSSFAGTRGWALALDTNGALYANVDTSSDVMGLYKTTDQGGIWTTLTSAVTSNGFFSEMVVSPTTPTTIFGVFSYIYRSKDGGQTWTAVASDSSDAGVYYMAIDPSNDANIYSSAINGVHKSKDGGDTWTLLSGNIPPIQLNNGNSGAIFIDPTKLTTVYVASETHGIYKSMSAGE